jgi:1-acyl-sn-glycerol-3-phosphate acyltransferase
VIRSLWVYLNALGYTLRYGGGVLLASLFRLRNTRSICDKAARNWSESFIRSSGSTVRITGEDRLIRDSAQIIVSNHESWFDVFALAARLPVRYRFVAKEELERVPLFGPAWKTCGHISIRRQDRSAAVESLDEAGTQVKEHRVTIVMFPEGTRSATGRLEPFRKGAFALAIQAGIPIVPVAVVGSRRVQPKGSWRITPGEIEIRIGEPIRVDGLSFEDRDRLRDAAWAAVAELKGEESLTGGGGRVSHH